MYLLYADDAGNTGVDYDNAQQPIFHLGGVIVPAKDWHKLNNRIIERKKEWYPDNPTVEIHAVDIFNGSNDRKAHINYRSFGEEKNMALLESIVDLIVELSLPVVMFTVLKSNLKGYCRKHFDGMVKIDPYFVALPYVLSFFDDYLRKKNASGIVFLDEQDSICQTIDEVLDRIRLFADGSNVLHTDRIIERAMFLESKKSNFVQLADVCNFITNRRNSLMYKNCAFERDKDKLILSLFEKIRPLILQPPFDPRKSIDALRFFDENYMTLK